ncbi:4Fe-4S binding protein [Pedobacter sp. SD-b]|uniref:4Fe-4S binding protein n=1 Tax=Pedobacter segetis TaxID=2793069 RepID=A0ABS1BJ51_9SPHI|nr:4Fe-4S dicluster domain-containing protein [Pedobacter segetis]MBK0382933.1 4Fe-4S binding protein [Pedobacter segetis]
MKIIRNTGLSIFLICFAVFLSLPFLGTYKLTEKTFKENFTDAQQQKILEPSLKNLFDKEYGNNISFISDYNKAFDNANKEFREKKEWDKVINDSHVLNIVKDSSGGFVKNNLALLFIICFLISSLGGLMYMVPALYLKPVAGIKNNHIYHRGITNRGIIAFLFAAFLIAFYICIYQQPAYLSNWILLVDGLSTTLTGAAASQWFLYGFLYCLVMSVMSVRMFIKYRNNNYEKLRTCSVLFFQIAFAFMIPNILTKLQLPSMDFKNIWPLDYTFFFDYHLTQLTSNGMLGYWMLGWGIFLIVVGVPVMVYFFGKRWYCSWVCGCGGLAETLGDPFRQLSDKSLKAWKFERIIVHSVLVFAVIMTAAVLYTFFTGSSSILGIDTYSIRQAYGFGIGFMFAGAIGTGFYPVMGSRVWCRFGCPLAAYLGIVQRFKSRFRITTNGGQCISCGNCSTYCEMGIDVRAYAQNGENIIRSSCVGCGVCAAVCPRGVLKLENLAEEGRFDAYVRPEEKAF